MKVLVSCLSKSWGGMEMYALTSLAKLLEHGIEASILCAEGTKIHNKALDDNLPHIAIHPKGYIDIRGIRKVSSVIKRQGFNVVHTQASKDLWLLVPALKLAGKNIPLFLTKQLGSFIAKKDFLHKWLYKRVDTAFAISQVIADNLVDTTPLTRDKIELLHNGIDVKRFDPEKISGKMVRDEFAIKDNETVVGMMARFSPGKGHEEFLYAAKELAGKKKNLRFMVVGEPSAGENEYAQSIYNMSKEYGLEERIIFTGFRSDTPEVLAAIDIFVFPSHAEALGIALIEAIAMGKPTVCSNSDGVLDIAVEGVTSYLFRKQDAADLTAKLEQLIGSPVKQKEFSVNARKQAEQKFDIEHLTGKVISCYKRALTKR